ncbi:BRO-N domain-containing protein [Amaricoccus solimangrovi]|uniref:Bro-N domain-containing protein n=1 Tax=Amaricoccus solimangrovi TaxID=2589815 RepID=A0A501WPG6_9RHOB|nr:BRO family protein [Amaricoccus solimangrovi]TPE48921.1 hypothetical protein FJM51_15950 [Amaricoccus solimangrovi]
MFEGHNIRVVEIDGEPWFVGVDVCRALGLDISHGASIHLKRLNKNDTRILSLNSNHGERDLTLFPVAPGGGRSKVAVNESGLYDLVLSSRKAEARVFKQWVTGTVLPAIRKDGGYVLGEEKVLTGEATIEELARSAFPCGGGQDRGDARRQGDAPGGGAGRPPGHSPG